MMLKFKNSFDNKAKKEENFSISKFQYENDNLRNLIYPVFQRQLIKMTRFTLKFLLKYFIINLKMLK